MHRLARALVFFPGITLVCAAAAAQDPSPFFDSNCAPCHTIGGGAQGGPDLKGLTARRTREWAVGFILDPQHAVDSKDPVAVAMVKQADGMVMPPTAGITPQLADALVSLIAQRSAQGAPVATVAPEATTPEDAALGGELFAGTRPFANRGPACLSCHDVAAIPPPGGGTFAPDLTRVHRRLGGTRGLNGWLTAPPTPMMRATFRAAPLEPAEVRALTAYLEKAASGQAEPPARRRAGLLAAISFPLIAGAVFVLGVAGRHRLRGVRRALVMRSTGGSR